MITSDSDLWPLSKEVYELTAGKSILSLNSECCAPFKHEGRVYKMLPLSNIGMNIETWTKVMKKFNLSPSTSEEMLFYLLKEFGEVAIRPVTKGENVGWYMDQMLVSMAIARVHSTNATCIKYSPRSTNVDRLDKGALWGQYRLEDKIDTHLPDRGFQSETFKDIKRLLELMYSRQPALLKMCKEYHLVFRDLMVA